MKILKLNSKKSKAQAMVEFAIVLPVLLLVVYGLIETGRLIFTVAFVNNATRQAVRYGSTSGVGPNGVARYLDCNGIRAEAERYDFLNSFNAANNAEFTITYDNGETPFTSIGNCNGASYSGAGLTTNDRVKINVNYRFNAIIPKLVPFISRTMSADSSRTLLLTISIEPPKKPTTTYITSDSPDPSQVGQPVTVSVQVTAASSTPTGTVAITGADTNCTVTLSGGTGSCVVIFSTFSGSGDTEDRTLTATYAGDTDHDGSSDTEIHTVEKAITEIVITSDTPDPSVAGGTVTVAVNVTSVWGGIPTGEVNITGADGPGGNPNCVITLSSGTGNCNVNFLSSGSKTLTATYVGDSKHKTASDTESHEVLPPGATNTAITSDSPDPSLVNQLVTVTVAVTSSTTPTGTVVITGQDSGCTAPINLSGGTGSCTLSFSSLGNKTLTATYTPDTPAFTGSSGTASHAVSLPATVTTITADSPDPSASGAAVSVTVTVTGGSTTPTGTVSITGADTNCTVTLSGGTGSCNVVFNSTTTATRTLTATYNGDSTHATSNDTETHTVTAAAVTGCNTVTVGLLQQSGGNMTMSINNPTSAFLQISNVTVTWNHDKGHQTGGDKTLILQSASLSSVFWTGTQAGPTYTITPASATFILPGTSTISFSFHQVFDRWDNTEAVTINLSNPGCEGVILFQNQH